MDRRVMVLVVACASYGVMRSAEPCSFIGPTEHVIDDEESQVDTTRPEVPGVQLTGITRGTGPERSGCGEMASSSCDDIGVLTLEIAAPDDDRTSPDSMGYFFEFEGTLPDGFVPPETALRLGPDGFVFTWIDGTRDNQEPIDMTITVSAVDLAGNMGEASEPLEVTSR